MDNKLNYMNVYRFLQQVDTLFPVPLSEKHDLLEFAKKLCNKATLCSIVNDNNIVALLAGYTDNVEDRFGYISVVAALPHAQGRGYSSSLIRDFLTIAQKKGLRAVHLYAVKDNIPAMHMYQKLGFVNYILKDEPRPNDAHLIYYLDKEVLP